MAKPQLENGHTRIANEILEHLAMMHLSANQWQVFLCIIRKTYGYQRKVDHIANSQICEATGLCKAVVSRVLHTLDDLQLIIRNGKTIGIQKNWENWKGLAIQSTLGVELAEQSTIESKQNSQPKLAISSSELAEQSTLVSSAEPENPPIKEKRNYTKETIQKKDIYIIPDWIDKDTWEAFLEMRKKKRAVPTEKAKELLVKELEKLRGEGQNPNEILNQSIMRNYTGVFPLKGGQNGAHRRDSTRLIPRKHYTRPQDYRTNG